MFEYDCLQLQVDVFILVWGWVGGVYLLFLNVRHCVVVGCSELLRFYFLDMAILHCSLLSCVDLCWPLFVARSHLVMVVANASVFVR